MKVTILRLLFAGAALMVAGLMVISCLLGFISHQTLLRGALAAGVVLVGTTAMSRQARWRRRQGSGALEGHPAPVTPRSLVNAPENCWRGASELFASAPYAPLSVTAGSNDQAWTIASTPPDEPAVLFELGSLTKVFTAVLLSKMAFDGHLTLGTSVGDLVPDVPEWVKPIPLLDLATHISGLPRLPPDMRLRVKAALGLPDPYGHLDGYGVVRSLSRLRPPRDSWRSRRPAYSNWGYALLGLALAKAADQSLPDLMRQEVLMPLGMTSTGYPATTAEAARAHGYDKGGIPVPAWRSPGYVGAGGLVATADDLGRFAIACLVPPADPTLAESLRLTLKPIVLDELTTVALGWQLRETRSAAGLLFWQNGGTGGSGSCLAVWPQRMRFAFTLHKSPHSSTIDELTIRALTGP